MLFDTHAHLDQQEFDDDREAVLQRAAEAGVDHIVAVGTTARSSRMCVAFSAMYGRVHAAVGIQPNYVAEATPDDWDIIARIAQTPGVVGIGETGLDRHWDYTPFDQQQDFFDRHIRLSQQLDMPLVIHMRDCEADILAMLREAAQRGPLRGVMHSFTGDQKMAVECVALGLHISFAGMLTYKKSEPLRQCAATIPDDRLLIETDSPYLSPEPVRGQRRNEPALLRHTAVRLAEVRGATLEEIAQQTTANAHHMFGTS